MHILPSEEGGWEYFKNKIHRKVTLLEFSAKYDKKKLFPGEILKFTNNCQIDSYREN